MKTFEITEINEDYLKGKKYLNKVKELNDNDILILPFEDEVISHGKGLRINGKIDVAFPEGTQLFLNYLKKETEINSHIIINDEDYKELQLHSDWIRLPIIMFETGLMPIVLSLIGNYIYDNFYIGKRKTKENVKITLIVKENDIKKEIKYEGHVDNINKILDMYEDIRYDKKKEK